MTLPHPGLGNPVIVRARQDFISEIARIHHESLPDDVLPGLGLDFLAKAYYPAAARSRNAVTLASLVNGRVVGFVTVARDSLRFTWDILRSGWCTLVWYALGAALRNPWYLYKNLDALGTALRAGRDPIRAEIVFIAVDRAHRGAGVGEALVSAAMGLLRETGVSACRTKTLAGNVRVIEMYERMGWQVRERFHVSGREYVTLVCRL